MEVMITLIRCRRSISGLELYQVSGIWFIRTKRKSGMSFGNITNRRFTNCSYTIPSSCSKGRHCLHKFERSRRTPADATRLHYSKVFGRNRDFVFVTHKPEIRKERKENIAEKSTLQVLGNTRTGFFQNLAQLFPDPLTKLGTLSTPRQW